MMNEPIFPESGSVEIVHWNPTRFTGRTWSNRFRKVPYQVNNFGDLLGPMIAAELSSRITLKSTTASSVKRLLTIGSIMHQARDGDTVWGTGVSGKHSDKWYRFTDLDVRAVRGPLTREFLLNRGISVPNVLGDPGLLVGQLWGRSRLSRDYSETGILVVPNLNDMKLMSWSGDVLDPCSPVLDCLGRIAASNLVVGSSLHGIITAESMGIPARLVVSVAESKFKYDDYYLGTGRPKYSAAHSVSEAIKMGGEKPPVVDLEQLAASFPYDLWNGVEL